MPSTPDVSQSASSALPRVMQAADLPAAVTLSQEAGWPHRQEDWALAFTMGQGEVIPARAVEDVADHPGGSHQPALPASDEPSGRDDLAGVCLNWHFGEVMTVGLIIVAQSYRGRGLASTLLNRALAQGEGRPALLFASPQGVPIYQRHDFRTIGEIVQCQGSVTPASQPTAAPASDTLRPVGTADLPIMATLDEQACGMPRYALLAALLEAGDGVVSAQARGVTGFAMWRRFGRGWLIGPVVAPDSDTARRLIDYALALCAGELVRIDVPAESALQPWLERRGLPAVGGATVMTRGAWPERPQGQVRSNTFALASQALG